MRPLAVLSIVAFALDARAFQNCPILGLSFPTPKSLSTSSLIQDASANLTATIEQTLQSGQSLDFNTSFSVGIFSIASSDLLFQYHHSAPSLVNSTTGITAVDADTIYRIGSVSKLLTVFTYLIELGDASWSDPVTKYIPELQTASGSDPVSSAAWADITVGALAAQLSGIGRDSESNPLSRMDILFIVCRWTGRPLLPVDCTIGIYITGPSHFKRLRRLSLQPH
jgi:hypothetical protein